MALDMDAATHRPVRPGDARPAVLMVDDTASNLELVQALETLEAADDPARLPRLLNQLQQQPTLSGAQRLLALPPQAWTPEAWAAMRAAVARSAAPLQRYRCAACGFEAQHYFWQCPGCLSWDSYPPQRLDAL